MYFSSPFLTKISQTFCFACFCLIFCSPLFGASLKISLIQTIDHPALTLNKEGILEEFETLGYKQGDTLMVDVQSAQGNPTLAVQIAQKFAASDADVIIALGTPAAQAAVTASKDKKIPVVFTAVTDPLSAKLVSNLKTPGGRITGVCDYVAPEPQFKLFEKLVPQLKTLGIVYNPGESNSTALIEDMEKAAKKMGWKIEFAAAHKTNEVFGATQNLCGKVDGIFINNDNTALSAFKSVVKAARSCDIPVFVSDVDIVDQGALAALGPDQRALGKQTARLVHRILKNPSATFPSVEFPEKTQERISP